MNPAMECSVVAASSWTEGGRDVAPEELPAIGGTAGAAGLTPNGIAPPPLLPPAWQGGGEGGGTSPRHESGGELVFRAAAEPVRPERITPGTWRRMSRLARLAAMAADPLLDEAAGSALIFGVSGGEFASSVAFLRSYFARGPALSSPLAFQNSVHNAPAAHLSIDAGLTAASETILGGERTLWVALERAMARVVVHRERVLLIIAEDLSTEVRDGLAVAGARGVYGEAAAAMLLGPAGEGSRALAWHDAEAPRGWGRSQGWLDERKAPRQPAFGWDLHLGLGAATEAAALVSLVKQTGWLTCVGASVEVR